MHVLMVTDAYPPMRTSCAVQMHDLAQAFLDEGHQATIVTPNSQLKTPLNIDWQEGVQVIQVKALASKDVNYVRRTLAEFINPFLIWRQLKRNPTFLNTAFDGVIWYSPTIFWGPLIKRIKGHFKVRSYLILRDIFPDWAIHLGILRRNLAYVFLRAVQHYQYRQADVIALQSPNNLTYFNKHYSNISAHLEVLWNWSNTDSSRSITDCSINLSQTCLAGKNIIVYAGNLGVAQGLPSLLACIANIQNYEQAGLVIVGRGSEIEKVKELVSRNNWKRVLIFDEIESNQIPALFSQCSLGLVVLDPRHQTHNIPGKFISYLQNGLPVAAILNPGNDLTDLITEKRVGVAITDCDADSVNSLLGEALALVQSDLGLPMRCLSLSRSIFASSVAAAHITSSLRTNSER